MIKSMRLGRRQFFIFQVSKQFIKRCRQPYSVFFRFPVVYSALSPSQLLHISWFTVSVYNVWILVRQVLLLFCNTLPEKPAMKENTISMFKYSFLSSVPLKSLAVKSPFKANDFCDDEKSNCTAEIGKSFAYDAKRLLYPWSITVIFFFLRKRYATKNLYTGPNRRLSMLVWKWNTFVHLMSIHWICSFFLLFVSLFFYFVHLLENIRIFCSWSALLYNVSMFSIDLLAKILVLRYRPKWTNLAHMSAMYGHASLLSYFCFQIFCKNMIQHLASTSTTSHLIFSQIHFSLFCPKVPISFAKHHAIFPILNYYHALWLFDEARRSVK